MPHDPRAILLSENLLLLSSSTDIDTPRRHHRPITGRCHESRLDTGGRYSGNCRRRVRMKRRTPILRGVADLNAAVQRVRELYAGLIPGEIRGRRPS